MEWMVYSGCGERRAAARQQGMRMLGILAGLVAVIGLIACGDTVQKERAREEAVREGHEQAGIAGMRFVPIPSGSFMMGSTKPHYSKSDEQPVHQVTISRAFYLQTSEVTQGQWQAVMGNNPSWFKKIQGDDYPVTHVSWDDVQEFLKKLNAMDPGKNYRLPTEAEWEYACRAGTTGEWYGELDAIAWHYDNTPVGEYGKSIQPVGKKQPNAWGLYDMLGNVKEWCADWYDENYYANSPSTDPRGPSSGVARVLRGGSYSHGVRSASRESWIPANGGSTTGFRCARD